MTEGFAFASASYGLLRSIVDDFTQQLILLTLLNLFPAIINFKNKIYFLNIEYSEYYFLGFLDFDLKSDRICVSETQNKKGR